MISRHPFTDKSTNTKDCLNFEEDELHQNKAFAEASLREDVSREEQNGSRLFFSDLGQNAQQQASRQPKNQNVSFFKALGLFFQNQQKQRRQREELLGCSVKNNNEKLLNSLARLMIGSGVFWGACVPFLSASGKDFITLSFFAFFALFSGGLLKKTLSFPREKIKSFVCAVPLFLAGFVGGQTVAVLAVTSITRSTMEDLFIAYPVTKERLFLYGTSEQGLDTKVVLADGSSPWNAFWWNKKGQLKEEFRAPFCQNFRRVIDQDIRATPTNMFSSEIPVLLLSSAIDSGYTEGCYTKKEFLDTLGRVRQAHKSPVFDLTHMKGVSLFGIFRQADIIIKPRSMGINRSNFCGLSVRRILREKNLLEDKDVYNKEHQFCLEAFRSDTLLDDNVKLGRVSKKDYDEVLRAQTETGRAFFEMDSLKPAEDILNNVPQLTEKDLSDVENLVQKNLTIVLKKDNAR